MLMVDVYYRINDQDDLGTANALGMVSYLMAMGVAGYYLRHDHGEGVVMAARSRAPAATTCAPGRGGVVVALRHLRPAVEPGHLVLHPAVVLAPPVPAGVGLFYWQKVLEGDLFRALQSGLLIAVVVTVLTLVLTVPLAYLLARYPVPFKPLILLVFLLPHAFPQLPVFVNATTLLYRANMAASVSGRDPDPHGGGAGLRGLDNDRRLPVDPREPGGGGVEPRRLPAVDVRLDRAAARHPGAGGEHAAGLPLLARRVHRHAAGRQSLRPHLARLHVPDVGRLRAAGRFDRRPDPHDPGHHPPRPPRALPEVRIPLDVRDRGLWKMGCQGARILDIPSVVWIVGPDPMEVRVEGSKW